MNVRFLVPPHQKQVGGIAVALEGLCQSLQRADVSVSFGRDPTTPDVFHLHGLWNPRHSLTCLKLHRERRPFIVSPHGMLEPWALNNKGLKKRLYLELLESRVLSCAARVFVTSEMERLNVLNVVPDARVEVHPLGLQEVVGEGYRNARKALEIADDEKVIIYLSRVDKKKGLDILLSVIEENIEEYAGISLFIVGDGSGSFEADARIRVAKLSGRIRRADWVGAVWGAQKWQYLQASDVFCLPTKSENFGIAILEALSVGTQVVTTDRTPWSDFKYPGLHICSPSKRDLRVALEKSLFLASEWSICDRKGLAVKISQDFDWSQIVKSYIASYLNVSEEGFSSAS